MAYRATDAMWAEAVAVLARADRLHRQFFRPSPVGWEPPIDIVETGRELVLTAALPGVGLDDLEVVIRPGELELRGIRRLPDALRTARVHRMEIPHGRFERHVRLPPGEYELGRPQLVAGCLTLVLRKLP